MECEQIQANAFQYKCGSHRSLFPGHPKKKVTKILTITFQKQHACPPILLLSDAVNSAVLLSTCGKGKVFSFHSELGVRNKPQQHFQKC